MNAGQVTCRTLQNRSAGRSHALSRFVAPSLRRRSHDVLRPRRRIPTPAPAAATATELATLASTSAPEAAPATTAELAIAAEASPTAATTTELAVPATAPTTTAVTAPDRLEAIAILGRGRHISRAIRPPVRCVWTSSLRRLPSGLEVPSLARLVAGRCGRGVVGPVCGALTSRDSSGIARRVRSGSRRVDFVVRTRHHLEAILHRLLRASRGRSVPAVTSSVARCIARITIRGRGHVVRGDTVRLGAGGRQLGKSCIREGRVRAGGYCTRGSLAGCCIRLGNRVDPGLLRLEGCVGCRRLLDLRDCMRGQQILNECEGMRASARSEVEDKSDLHFTPRFSSSMLGTISSLPSMILSAVSTATSSPP